MPEALTLNVRVSESGSSNSSVVGGVGGRSLLGSLAQGVGMGAGFGAYGMIAGAIQKGLEGSPLFQGMSKLMSTAVEQILRPIGDVVGTLIRPMAISLIKMSSKWIEWMTTVDGKAFMQIIQGIGEVLAGVGQVIFASLFKMPEMGAEGLTNIIGGLGRVATASDLAARGGEAASLALDKLAMMDTADIVNKMVSLGNNSWSVAQDLLSLSEAVIAAKRAMQSDSGVGSASDPGLTVEEKRTIYTTPFVVGTMPSSTPIEAVSEGVQELRAQGYTAGAYQMTGGAKAGATDWTVWGTKEPENPFK